MTCKHIAAICFVFSLTFLAQAENIENHDNRGDYKYFTDAKSGKDWRGFKGMHGMSYETILKKLDRDDSFKGWKLASEQEIKELISNTIEVPVADLEDLVVSGDEKIIQLIRLFDGGVCNSSICVAGIISDPALTCSHSNAEEDEQCRKFIKIEARLSTDQAAWERLYPGKPVDGCDGKVLQDPNDPRQPCVITYGDVLPDMSIDRVLWLRNDGAFLVRPSH